MVSLFFCLAAFVLFTIGYRLVKRGSPFSRSGGDNYTRKKRRRTLGQMLWATAGVLLVIALIDFVSTSGPSIIPAGSIAVGNPHDYSAPVLPTTPADVAKARAAFSPVPAGGNATNEPGFSAAGRSSFLADDASTRSSATEGNRPDTNEATTPANETNNSSPLTDSGISIANTEGPKDLDADSEAANAAIQKDPSNMLGYVLRGNVYGKKKMWDLARKDYKHALELDSTCVPALFNLAQIDFMQGKYDAARPGFAALEQDSDFGDLAKYSVFLCDLAGGHEDAAAKELDAFNQVGSNASYYFANVAWFLRHRKDDDARSWMASAIRIYAPEKVHLYAKPLVDLGYLSTAPAESN